MKRLAVIRSGRRPTCLTPPSKCWPQRGGHRADGYGVWPPGASGSSPRRRRGLCHQGPAAGQAPALPRRRPAARWRRWGWFLQRSSAPRWNATGRAPIRPSFPPKAARRWRSHAAMPAYSSGYRELRLSLVSTSANFSGDPDTADAALLPSRLRELVDLFLDAGRHGSGDASVVMDLSASPFRRFEVTG